MKIVVLGYIVRGPLGGLVWHHLQYMIGLKLMGHQVLFLEDSDNFPSCYNPGTFQMSENPTYGITFLKEVFHKYDLANNWSYFDAHTNSWFGQTENSVRSFCKSADIVLNVSAVNPARDWWNEIPTRILIDTDPVFTQIRHLNNYADLELAKAHNLFLTFGENFRKPGCTIPDDGLNWKPTRQPVVREIWNNSASISNNRWTTVMQWDSYKEQIYKSNVFGMKSMSFQDFNSFPELMNDEQFQLALGGTTAPVAELQSKGWDIVSSLIPTKTPLTYQEYIAESKGEWSVAKHGYVASNSGWFSERSTCYLASGKPVVVQETGFSEFIETGKGLFSFKTVEEAKQDIDMINSDYQAHCKYAKQLIDEYFDYRKVLNAIIKSI